MKALNLCLVVLLLAGQHGVCRASGALVIRPQDFPSDGLLIAGGWRFQAGDSARWADPDYNDNRWRSIDPSLDIRHIPFFDRGGICWFRLTFTVDSALGNQPIGILLSQVGASEVWLNGALIFKFGKVGATREEEITCHLQDKPLSILLDGKKIQTLAIRYSYQRRGLLVRDIEPNYCFHIVMNNVADTFQNHERKSTANTFYELSQASTWALLGLMSMILYFSLRDRKLYIYVAGFSYCGFSAGVLGTLIAPQLTSTGWYAWIILLSRVTATGSMMFAMKAFLMLFNQPKDRYYYGLNILCILALSSFFFSYDQADNILLMVMLLCAAGFVIRTWSEVRHNRPGATILFACQIFFFGSFALAVGFRNIGWLDAYRFSGSLGAISIPLCWTIFLAGEYVRTRHTLHAKAEEVELLNETMERKIADRTEYLLATMKDLEATQMWRMLIERQLAIQAERRRISADLHDDIGSTLSSVNIYAGLARNTTDKDGYLETIIRIVSDVVVKLDDLVWSINPRLNTLTNVMDRIAANAEPTSRLAGITLRMDMNSELGLLTPTPEVKHHLYMIIRECINNAIRHAGCRSIDVGIRADRDDLLVTVTDDGRGFDQGSGSKGRNGLANIFRRAAEVNGVAAIRSIPGAGTEIQIRLPLDPALALPLINGGLAIRAISS